MNELISYLILGFVQGVTEFFPISSSGHLVLFEDFLGINNAGASAEIIAHFGTLFSIILFYRATFFSYVPNLIVPRRFNTDGVQILSAHIIYHHIKIK